MFLDTSEISKYNRSLMRTTTPPRLTPAILKFCRRIVPNREPVYLEVQTSSQDKALDCFENVKKRVQEAGGSIQYGWHIWEWPAVMLEAEFHSVWISPDGSLIDVSPQPSKFSKVLFLPDPVRIYQGRRVNNIRMALSDDPSVHEFIEVNDRIFEETNKGDLAYKKGEIALPADVIVPLLKRKQELQLKLTGGKVGRNDQCPCGSGLKYKKCHGG